MVRALVLLLAVVGPIVFGVSVATSGPQPDDVRPAAGAAIGVAAGPVLGLDAAPQPARRGPARQVGPLAPGPPVCAGDHPDDLDLPPSARQVLVVRVTTGSSARAELWGRDGAGPWLGLRCGMVARVGRNGVRPLAQRVSGDGTTPAGLFPLATETAWDGQRFSFFGNRPDPGVPSGWRQVRPEDCWDATGGRPTYNTLRIGPGCPAPDEWLPRYGDVYEAAAVIGANTGPDRSGDQPGEVPRAAAIFLHRHSYTTSGATKATSGCVSLAHDDLVAVLRRLVPGEAWFSIV